MVKLPRLGLGPDLAQALEEGRGCRSAARRATHARSMPQTARQVSTKAPMRDDGDDLHQPRRRVGVEELARDAAVTAMPKIIISQVIVAAAGGGAARWPWPASARSEVPDAPTPRRWRIGQDRDRRPRAKLLSISTTP
jgi:hypothetical protein